MTAFTNIAVIDTETASNKFAAAVDAGKRNAVNFDLYTDEQVAMADDFYITVCNTFLRSRVFKNYRQKFIAVKVDKVQRADLATLAAGALEEFCAEHDVKVKKTRTNAMIFELKLN